MKPFRFQLFLNRQRQAAPALVLLCLLCCPDAATSATVEVKPQVISLPLTAAFPRFLDVTGDGRRDLVFIDAQANKLLRYHQHPDGFSNSPDESISLPPLTAWLAVGEVELHQGRGLIASTANGLFYSRPEGASFENRWRILVETNQIFLTNANPGFIRMTDSNGTMALPVISADHAVVFRQTNDGQWVPGAPIVLEETGNSTGYSAAYGGPAWSLGGVSGLALQTSQSWFSKSAPVDTNASDNASIRKLIQQISKASAGAPVNQFQFPLAGQDRQEVLLCQFKDFPDAKADLYYFHRQSDGSLPARPTQTLHCAGSAGYPTQNGWYSWPPVQDLNKDGGAELVLLEFKTRVTSATSAAQAAISEGLDWSLTIRPLIKGQFSTSPVAEIPLTMLLSAQRLEVTPITANDFNGDGRPDLLVRRSLNQWNVFFSTGDKRWFETRPSLSFTTPANGYPQLANLRGGSQVDFIWQEDKEIRIYWTPSPPAGPANKP